MRKLKRALRRGQRPPIRNRRAWPGVGASVFPAAPNNDPATVPAHWSAAVLATTVILESGTAPRDPLAHFPLEVLDVQVCRDGLHLVALIANERSRLWQRETPSRSDAGATIAIPLDSGALWRSRASQRLLSLLSGEIQIRPDRMLTPTAYQRRRLVTALAIIDGLTEGLGVRDIAFAVVFPRTRPLTGATWKGSSERRHTQRLIRESLRLRDGGYLAFPGFA